jgi:hypothetical protein
MDWWFKSERYPVNPENINKLQEALRDTLRNNHNLDTARLYDDNKGFFIKTTGRISLNHFLFQHGFEETEHVKPESALHLLYGAT